MVKLSVLGVGRGGNDPITNWHRAGEQELRDTDLHWTVLRPTGFMTNCLEWAYSIRATGTVAAPFPDGRTTLVDPPDIARVAAVILTQTTHHGRVYELTGPEALTPGDQVCMLSEVLGRPITYIPQDPDVAKSQFQQYGMPIELADAVIQLLATAREPWNEQPLPSIQGLTGHAATDFRTWATDHRDAFLCTRRES